MTIEEDEGAAATINGGGMLCTNIWVPNVVGISVGAFFWVAIAKNNPCFRGVIAEMSYKIASIIGTVMGHQHKKATNLELLRDAN